MSRNGGEYSGNIIAIREIEDSIRATKKYKEFLGTMRAKHPIQGEDFPSAVVCKHYEVYPEMEVSFDMPFIDAVVWLGLGTPIIGVKFKYDYRVNKAEVEVRGGLEAVKALAKAIPGFSEAIAKVAING